MCWPCQQDGSDIVNVDECPGEQFEIAINWPKQAVAGLNTPHVGGAAVLSRNFSRSPLFFAHAAFCIGFLPGDFSVLEQTNDVLRLADRCREMASGVRAKPIGSRLTQYGAAIFGREVEETIRHGSDGCQVSTNLTPISCGQLHAMWALRRIRYIRLDDSFKASRRRRRPGV